MMVDREHEAAEKFRDWEGAAAGFWLAPLIAAERFFRSMIQVLFLFVAALVLGLGFLIYFLFAPAGLPHHYAWAYQNNSIQTTFAETLLDPKGLTTVDFCSPSVDRINYGRWNSWEQRHIGYFTEAYIRGAYAQYALSRSIAHDTSDFVEGCGAYGILPDMPDIHLALFDKDVVGMCISSQCTPQDLYPMSSKWKDLIDIIPPVTANQATAREALLYLESRDYWKDQAVLHHVPIKQMLAQREKEQKAVRQLLSR